MDHVAIMKKSWGLIDKILSGEKTIESRWYKAKYSPWNKISDGDTVYFKNAGEPVIAQAQVAKVLQFSHYTDEELIGILSEYSANICFFYDAESVLNWAKDRRYVILIFIKGARKVKPFLVSKKGFGSACAWMTIEHINTIKI